MTIASNFEIGDVIKTKDSAWDEYGKELQRFGFMRGATYEVSGVYNQGSTISIQGSWSNYYAKYFELHTGTKVNTETKTKPDAVNHPKHYAVFEQLEAIEVIASSMTTEQFYGYCLGNILKYRLRAGGKDDVMQELGKADKYQELFTRFKFLCKDAV